MKKRSMLAIASLAAGVVTALVSPPPHATADTGAAGPTGLLQNDTGLDTLLEETAPVTSDGTLEAPGIPQAPGTGPLA
ncbi:hypothetical protein ACWDX6_15590 [Streptomyces sp. NPDC003027]